jgi:hypothetical protein
MRNCNIPGEVYDRFDNGLISTIRSLKAARYPIIEDVWTSFEGLD